MTTRLPAVAMTALLVAVLCSSPAVAADAGDQSATVDAGAASAPHAEASLTQEVETDGPIETGETVVITLRITHPAGADVRFPETYGPTRWELVEAAPQTARGSERDTTSIWRLVFGIYRPGEATLEPFDVEIVTASGEETSLRTEPVTMKVVSVLADLEEDPTFRAPRPPVSVWVEDYTLAWVGGGAGVLGLLGLLFLWAWRRQQMLPDPPPPPRKPHEIALEKLGALAGDDLVERGEYMIFWVRLSEAIREYLGRTHGFPPTELTTTEVLEHLEDVRWPPGLDLQDVERFLRRCDEVKFGGDVPTVAESSESLRRAFSIVELTRPRSPEEDDSSAEALVADSDPSSADEEPDDTDETTADENRWAPPDDGLDPDTTEEEE